MALEKSTLYVVATPIGNLGDVTARALLVLREVDWIAAEDTRHTRRLLAHFGIAARLLSAHAHNEAARARDIEGRLARGETGALVVDAGSPGISDPGQHIVRRVSDAGFAVRAVPGPSALVAALSVSGLPVSSFTFAGFPPARAAARRARLAELLARRESFVFFEAPHRARAALADLAGLAPGRPVAACRELTKVHEEVLRGRAADVAARVSPERERGEWVVVVAGAEDDPGEAREDDAPADPARARFVADQEALGATREEALRRADFVLGRKKNPAP